MLAAAALAVAGLAAWATVFVPHGEAETGLERSALVLALGCAALLAAAVGVAARRLAPAPALLIGALTLGLGLLSSTVGVTTPGLLTSLVPVAAGTGLLLAAAPRFLSPGPAPAAVAAAAAAGTALGGFGSARTVFALGGAAALAGAVLLLRLDGAASPALVREVRRRGTRFATGTALLLAVAAAIQSTVLLELDKAAFEALHGLGATPELIESLLVEPSLRNYVIIVIAVSLVGARYWGRTTPGRTLLLVAGTGIVAYVGVRTCWALWERPRPEEVLGIDPGNGHSWAAYPSFPSGHVAVTTALALATAALVPRLRYLLWAYAVLIAFTRLAYGAHFPSDVLLGFALGWLAVQTTLPRGAHSQRILRRL